MISIGTELAILPIFSKDLFFDFFGRFSLLSDEKVSFDYKGSTTLINSKSFYPFSVYDTICAIKLIAYGSFKKFHELKIKF